MARLITYRFGYQSAFLRRTANTANGLVFSSFAASKSVSLDAMGTDSGQTSCMGTKGNAISSSSSMSWRRLKSLFSASTSSSASSSSVSAVAYQNSVRFNMPPASVSVSAPWAMFSPYMPVFANSWSR